MQEAAEALGVTPKAVQRRIDRGTIKGSEMRDGRRMIPMASIYSELPEDRAKATLEEAVILSEVSGLELLTQVIEQSAERGRRLQLEQKVGELEAAHSRETEILQQVGRLEVQVKGLLDQIENLEKENKRLTAMLDDLPRRRQQKVGYRRFEDQDADSDAHKSDLTPSQD